MREDFCVRIDREQARFRYVRFWFADRIHGREELTVEIGRRERIAVHEIERAYTRAEERFRRVTAYPAQTEHRDAGVGKPTDGGFAQKLFCPCLPIFHERIIAHAPSGGNCLPFDFFMRAVYNRFMSYEKVFHTLAPVYDTHSRVLVLGSLPSPKSRAVGFYYGHPQNRFWRVLSAVLDEPLPVTVDEKRALVLRRSIALWDVIAECDIDGASDASIKNARPNDFSLITDACNIHAVFTVGKTATALYKKFTGKESICLPSPSPANCATSEDKLIVAFEKIKEFLQ